MSVRLNKVTRDLNVGITTAVEFLQKKGFTVEANPNTKITDEQFDMLVKAFSKDKDLKIKSEKFSQERKSTDRNKASVGIEGYNSQEQKKEEKQERLTPEEKRQKYKPLGKIDLDALGRGKPVVMVTEDKVAEKPAEKVQETPAAHEASKAHEAPAAPAEKTQPQAAEAEPVQTPVEKPHPHMEDKKEDTAAPAAPAARGEKQESAAVVVEKTAADSGKETAVAAGTSNPAPVADHSASSQDASATAEKAHIEKLNEAPAKPVTEQTVSAVKEETNEEKKEEIFKIHQPELVSKINVIGQIDLAALNQSTRPKKKSKEEKKKEREEKEKQRQDQRKQMKEAIIKEIRRSEDAKGGNRGGNDNDSNGKKKRNRIGKEKVDINNVQSYQQHGGNNNNRGGNQQGGNQQGGNSKRGGKDRFKKGQQSQIKQEVSEEDVAKQVKETLARLTSKGKNKAAKYRKEKREQAADRLAELENQEMAESKVLKLTEFVTANELANMMDISVTQVIATCMSVGIMVSINQRLDAETINLVAEEFGFKTEYVSAEVAQAIVEEEDAEEDLEPRAPIVTVMGHVDHGKTSLLDYIRKANVIAGEAGGITQHIGAYHVTLEDGRKITFLDTPGHEAFTAMRARGAKVTDVVIIIVAADDDVMPQTKEAINHAMAAGVPIVFAINKVDKPTANPDKIKEQLAAMNFLVEEWGGKYQSQDISAKKGIGVKELLEKVLLEAEMLDLKANPNRNATGSIIESSLDKGRGYVATVLVSNGTLKMGDIVLAGTSYGRVKAMFNERNQRLKEAGPSEPALILGLNGAPAAGDTFHVIDTEQEAREIANKREQLQREQGLRTQKMLTLDEVGRRLALGDFHELNVIVKGDVDGSVEALGDSLIKLSTEQVQVNVIHKGVGQISESDVSLAAASDAIIVGFQVRPSGAAAKLAEQEGVDIRKYSVIYDAIEEVKSAMEGMLAPTLKEQVTATIEVREVFNISKVGLVAGAMVKSGKVARSNKARLIRDGIVIFTGAINALKRFKDDVKEVGVNFECGISLQGCNDIKVGDIIESYEEVEVKATL